MIDWVLSNLFTHPDLVDLDWLIFAAKVNIFWKSFIIVGFLFLIVMLFKRLSIVAYRKPMNVGLCVVILMINILLSFSIIANVAILYYGFQVPAILCNFEFATNVVYTITFFGCAYLYRHSQYLDDNQYD